MAEIVIIHSVLGIHPSLVADAERLREQGHTVHLPDLWDGAVYDTIAEGIEHRDRIGFGPLIERTRAAVEPLPSEVVYMGYSLGGMLAQMLAQERPGARGAILMHNVELPEEFDAPWPEGVPMQAHIAEGDDWADIDVAAASVDEISAVAPAELFLYPGETHLFTHRGTADFDAEASSLAAERIREFLAKL